jgi:cobalt-zinc-cadmium efflux system membrane fusion protein
MLLLFAAVALSCSRKPQPEPVRETKKEETPKRNPEEGVVQLSREAQASAGIRTAPAESRPLAAEIETTGEVGRNEDRTAHVGPRVAGRITAVNAVLGQRVGRGQALAVIDSTELGQTQADYLQARAQEDLAKTTFDRESRLAAEKISSQKEVLEARAALLQAQAARRSAEEKLRLFGLTAGQIDALGKGGPGAALLPVAAPFDGVVIEKTATLGEVVAPEQKLFTVADLKRVWIWIDVFEKDLRHVHLEDGADVQVDAFPGESFRGKVSFLSAQVDPGTRTVRARIDVDNPGGGDGRLRPGMFARVRLSDPHATEGTPVVVVPEAAVQRRGDGFVVFVQEGEGRFRVRPVKTGRKAGGVIEVLEGLKAGEPVAVQGVFFLASEAAKASFGEED